MSQVFTISLSGLTERQVTSELTNVPSGNPKWIPSTSVQFSAASYEVTEAQTAANLTINRTGDASNAVNVDYSTSDGTAKQKTDYTFGLGTVNFAAGETSKTISILINDDSFSEGPESFTVTLANSLGATPGASTIATVNIADNASEPSTNPIDEAQNFVSQQYRDFLNRQPDAGGLNFWANQIASCGANAACIDDKRNNVSAAFFVSIEFQNTGYFVYRAYNGTLNRPNNLPAYIEFLRDTQAIQQNVVVGVGNWEQQLDTNKTAYCNDLSNRAEFIALYPLSMTGTQYVDALFAHALITPTSQERQAAIDEFNNPTGSRGRALRKVIENPTLTTREFNRAFVLMQYFGYLRRNPNDPPDSDLAGLNFWLGKLNDHNGNYISSEMVRSFLVSTEYRGRFGTP